jgi:hypothetical protein
MQKKIPIIFFVHRRPSHTLSVLKVINKYKFYKLYIISDGYNSPLEKNLILQVRDIIKKFKKNKTNVRLKMLKKNLGIRKIFKFGIDWVLKKEDKFIVLEDDTLPNKFFFKFCEKMLINYKDNKKISMISGSNLNDRLTKNIKNSFFFSRYSGIWGWASWKDRWLLYDNKLSNLKNFSFDKNFSNKNEIKFWKNNFNYLSKNLSKGAWDFPLTFTNFYHNKLSIVPKLNLVSNIGYDDPSGINPAKNANLKNRSLKLPFTSPKSIESNKLYDEYCSKNIYSVPSLWYRIKFKIKKFLN